jgi:hypothetical protein
VSKLLEGSGSPTCPTHHRVVRSPAVRDRLEA